MYKAIYRKYRPQTFEDLVGQEHITTILENQIWTNLIGHAYLFSGTRGTGKTSCAKIFARAINCIDENKKPCNKCENCQESLDESSIDIIEIDAASNNGVDNIRDLKDRAFYQPTSLKYKVYIIDEVHMLSKGAFNALLKILEEPPAHLIFILATTEPERIPLTILSRCQKFQFKRITNKDMLLSLKKIAEAEGIKIDEETYKLILNSADGSMRDAQSILEQLVSSGRDEISYEFASNVLGIVDKSSIIKILDSILENDASKLLELIDISLLAGKDTEQLGKDILSHVRSIMIAKVSPNSFERFISDDKAIYIKQADRLSLDKILKAMEKLINQLNEIKFSQQKRALLEIALLEIFEIVNNDGLIKDKNTSASNVIEGPNISTIETYNENNNISLKNSKIENKKDDEKAELKKENLENSLVSDKEKETTNQETSKLSKENILKDWNDILFEIKNSNKKMLHAYIVEATVLDYINGTITLGFHKDYGFHMNNLLKDNNREFVEKVIGLFYNTNVKINAKFIEENLDSIDKDIETLTSLVGKEKIKIF